MLLRHPHLFPFASYIAAIVEIQRYFRGFIVRKEYDDHHKSYKQMKEEYVCKKKRYIQIVINSLTHVYIGRSIEQYLLW